MSESRERFASLRYCCSKHYDADCASLTPLGRIANARMILCSICGNKRCPKATDCGLECTGSNEPGQPGSAYTVDDNHREDGAS